ncbi:MAG: hypothetical protein DSZ25_00660, partial [Thermovibrio sp.]
MEKFTLTFSLFLFVLLISYLVSQRLKFPVIPVYIVSGILTSLFVHAKEVHIFEFLGVVFLLFFIGLECLFHSAPFFAQALFQRNSQLYFAEGLVHRTSQFQRGLGGKETGALGARRSTLGICANDLLLPVQGLVV